MSVAVARSTSTVSSTSSVVVVAASAIVVGSTQIGTSHRMPAPWATLAATAPMQRRASLTPTSSGSAQTGSQALARCSSSAIASTAGTSARVRWGTAGSWRPWPAWLSTRVPSPPSSGLGSETPGASTACGFTTAWKKSGRPSSSTTSSPVTRPLLRRMALAGPSSHSPTAMSSTPCCWRRPLLSSAAATQRLRVARQSGPSGR
mmetsp:Transcript_5999/g.14300  ORF Transcript_5999/g.14300 Transcript_5999/m.14300 type:complete len:204 (-) Transcript_5999:764-1375(-)